MGPPRFNWLPRRARARSCGIVVRTANHRSGPRAPPDFFDHGTVVEVRFALPHAGFQHVGMDLEHGKLLLYAFGLLQDEMHILEVLGDPPLGGELAAGHLGTL